MLKIRAILISKILEPKLHLELRVIHDHPKLEDERYTTSLQNHRSLPDHLQDRDWRLNLKAVAKLGKTAGWDSPDLKLCEEALCTVDASLHMFITSMLMARETGDGEELQLGDVSVPGMINIIW